MIGSEQRGQFTNPVIWFVNPTILAHLGVYSQPILGNRLPLTEGKKADGNMSFQVWLRQLLCDAISANKAYIVARLSPHALRNLYDQGISPTVEAIAHHSDGSRAA